MDSQGLNNILSHCFLGALLTLSSCGIDNGFYSFHKRRFVFSEAYSLNDTVLVHHHLFFGEKENFDGIPAGIAPWGCYTDSVFFIYKESLLNSGIPIKFLDGGMNKVLDSNSIFSEFPGVFENTHIKRRDYKHVLALAAQYQENHVLIPVVRIWYSIDYASNIRRFHGIYYHIYLTFSAYVFHENSLVYYKTLSYNNEYAGRFQLSEYQLCDVPIDPNLIDRLVKQVMIDYTKRLK